MITRIIDLESNLDSPELVAFLNATTLEEASLYAQSLKPNYVNVKLTSLNTSSGEVTKTKWFGVSLFTIACLLGKSLQLDVLIGHQTPDAVQRLILDKNYEAFRRAALNGHSAVIEKLITLAPAEIANMIKARDYEAFRRAAENGHLVVIEKLIASVPTEIANMIQAEDYEAFRYAAQKGHLAVIEKLIILAPTEIANMIKARDYEAFRRAAENGHLVVIEKLIASVPTEIANMIQAEDYKVFRYAAHYGRLAVIEKLITLAPAETRNMIKANNYEAFRAAAENGHLAVIEKLITLAPTKIANMIKAKGYEAFISAASNGHLAVIEKLITLAPTEIANMIKAKDYEAFRHAAYCEHLAVIEKLIALAPIEIANMIKAKDYVVFRHVASNGHLSVIEKLITLAPTKIANMIEAQDYEAFRAAAHYGHLAVIEKLITLAPAEIVNMIQAQEYYAFRYAASNGRLDVIEKLITLASTEIANMIKAQEYYAFRHAAHYGHLAVIEKLITLAPAEIANMIEAIEYCAFRAAAHYGHLAVIEKLITLAPTKIANMIKAEEYYAFRYAADKSHLAIVNKLLTYSIALSFAEEHDDEYGARYIRPFVADQLASLHARQQQLAETDAHLVFDLTDTDEAKRCFYFIRHLIRRNDPILLDEIRFLLSIPAVKALAAAEVTLGRSNELLRLALTSNNQAAAEILLQVPAVFELAQRNQFYRDEARGQFDLSQVARDRESSMHALSTGEAKRLEKVLSHYQPIINDLSVENIFTMLCETLRERYAASPARIKKDEDSDLVLPIEWGDFKKLTLTEKERQAALEAYYQNKDHSVLRYLSKPNRWMNANAEYVEVDPAHTQDRWSTFQEYKPLIVLLYLAATDENIPGIDGHTLEGRIAHFIDELALIGRAHNWDRTNAAVAEFDDMTGDRPSCYSGVKRRLFQSVIGHPLITILTLDIIKQELQTFVHDYFVSCINDGNRKQLQDAFAEYKDSGESEDAQPLRELDIPPEKQAAFVVMLTQKYPEQFIGDPSFKKYIMERFERTRPGNLSPYIHMLKFSGIVSLESLLAEKKNSGLHMHGTFAAGSSMPADVSGDNPVPEISILN